MKILFFTALWFCQPANFAAQNTFQMETQQNDSSAIETIVEDIYLKSLYEGNVPLLRSLFHPGTLLFGDIQGQPYAKTLDAYLEGVGNRQSPKNSGLPFSGKVLSVRVVNSIAVAEVEVAMYTFIYRDFLSFHKLNGQWLIVSKLLTDTHL